MSKRKKPEARCQQCQMRREKCICQAVHDIKKVLPENLSYVSVIMHHREEKLTTNTARLAKLILPNCQIHIRGKLGCTLSPDNILIKNRTPIFLYPSENAAPLTHDLANDLVNNGLAHDFANDLATKSLAKGLANTRRNNIQLIVPDGSWRQASKVAKREAWLKDVAHVYLSENLPSKYFLRDEPKAGGLATFEAIARALGFFHGKTVQRQLESVFELMVKNTLSSRGFK